MNLGDCYKGLYELSYITLLPLTVVANWLKHSLSVVLLVLCMLSLNIANKHKYKSPCPTC
jgi:hypothetical protein